MNESSTRKGGYAVAFGAGLLGGALLVKAAPILLARLQDHCQQMMREGCCGFPPKSGPLGVCCEPTKEREASSEETPQEEKVA